MAQNSKETSQYLQTPVKNWYLDLWVPRKVSTSDYDNLFVIPPEFDQRPDLLSQQEYGTPALWWVFAVRNPDLIIDPINDFVSGLEIFIPPNPLKQQ
jgi:hypothetical protein